MAGIIARRSMVCADCGCTVYPPFSKSKRFCSECVERRSRISTERGKAMRRRAEKAEKHGI